MIFVLQNKGKKRITKKIFYSQFGVACSDDLFDAHVKQIQDGNGKNRKFSLKTVMDTWVNQKGYPVLDVTSKDNEIKITQKRFVTGQLDEKDKHVYKYYVPINYATEDKPNFKDTSPIAWLTPEDEEISFKAPKDKWLIVNIQQTGKRSNFL